MTNKKFWLGILAAALVLGMTVVGCEEDKKDDNGDDGAGKDQHLEGPLYNLTFCEVTELNATEISYLENTATTNEFGSFTKTDGGYDWAVMIDYSWYKVKPYPMNFYHFGWWGKSVDILGQNPQTLPFDYVDANHIKIDGEVYKYELSTKKTKAFDYSPSDALGGGSRRETGTVESQVLKIYIDGDDEDPLLLWSNEKHTTVTFL